MSNLEIRRVKKSNEDWIESIPLDWSEKKVGLIFNTIGSGTTPSTLQEENYGAGVPWLTTGELRESTITKTQKEVPYEIFNQTSALKKFPVNSIAIAMYGATIGRLGILGVEACTNQACCVLADPKNGYYQFYYYCFQAAKASIIKKAIGGGQPNINQDIVRALRFPNPSFTEQRQIAAYLNRETAKIDKLIAKQQKLIKLLQEKRQAMISQAVTEGLDPTIKMKDSGVEWFPSIPFEWASKRLKNICSFVTSGPRGWGEFQSDQGAVFLRITNLTRSSTNLLLNDIQRVSPPLNSEGSRTKIRKGDVLISITADLGSVAYIDQTFHEDAYISQHLAMCRPNNELLGEWLSWFVLSDVGKTQFGSGAYGGTKIQLNLGDVRNFRLAVPPESELPKLIDHLKDMDRSFNNLKIKCEEQIRLLKEHHQALITAAVTGKIDVRGLITDDEVAALDAETMIEDEAENSESDVPEDSDVAESLDL